MCAANRLRPIFHLLASAGAVACSAPPSEHAAAPVTARSHSAFSSEPVRFSAEEVERVLGELPPPVDGAQLPGAPSTEERGSKQVWSGGGAGALATGLPVWPARVYPTKTLYFVPPDFIKITQLNGRGDFVGSRFEEGAWFPVLGRWDGGLDVRRLTSTSDSFRVGDFSATGMDDRGIVVGRVVIGVLQTGMIQFATAWLDASLPIPVVHQQSAPGARSSEWLAVSRSVGFAVGKAASYTEGVCQGLGTSDAWPLLGRYDRPATGPVVDATSIPCLGCIEQPAVTRALNSVLLGVNDVGEAVGSAEVRDADWSCGLRPAGWSGYYFDTRGVQERPIYVAPGGIAFELAHMVSPSLSGIYAVGINDAGVIAGTGVVGNSSVAFRHDVRTGATATIPWVAGATSMRSHARQVNGLGHVLAWLSTCLGHVCRASTVVWSPDDQVYDLGLDLSFASLNDRGEVVGSTCTYYQYGYSCRISKWQLPHAKLAVVVSRAVDGGEASGFDMLPSVTSSGAAPYGVGEQALALDVRCVAPSGEVARDCQLALTWKAETGSGGHVHDTKRPPGLIRSASGRTGGSTGPGSPGSLSESTGSSGVLGITYVAPEASGVTRLEVTGTAWVDGQRISSDSTPFSIRVKYDGLVRAAAPGLAVASASNNHGQNNGYATPEMASALADVASAFAEGLTRRGVPPNAVPAIRVTALSLPLGGLFDFRDEWRPPHVTHRFGVEADVGMAGLTAAHKEALSDAVHQADIQTPVSAESPRNPEASHWHVSL